MIIGKVYNNKSIYINGEINETTTDRIKIHNNGNITLSELNEMNGVFRIGNGLIYTNELIENDNGTEPIPFNPSSFGGLKVWFDASTINLADNTKIAQWVDLSGNNNHAIQPIESWQPTIINSMLNLKPIIRVNGSNMLQTINDLNITGNQPRDIILIFRQIGSMSNRNVIGFGINGTGAIFDVLTHSGQVIGHFHGGGYDTIGYSPTYTIDAFQIYRITETGTGIKMYKNGNYVGGSGIILNTANSPLRIGAGTYQPYDYFIGDFAEIIIYNKSLTDEEYLTLNQYLSEKWGVV